MLALMNAVRIARDYNLPYFFTWMTHGRSSEELQSPTEIFNKDWFEAHFVSHTDFSAISGIATDVALLPLSSGPDLIQEICSKDGGFLCMNTELAVLPWEDEQEVASRYAAVMNELEMSEAINAAKAAVDRTLSGHGVAFHIRRGDIIHDPATSNQLWSGKYIPREFYETMARRLIKNPETRILVFSDEPSEIARLKTLGNQIVSPDEILPKDLTLAQRDFMEIYAMSHCQQILGPPGSGFSTAAGLMGNRKVTDIQSSLTPEERTAALDLLVERLKARSEVFINSGDIGQSLSFACDHLNATGRKKEALELLDSLAAEGFSKLYFFRLHLSQQIQCQQFDRYDDVLERMRVAKLDPTIPGRLEQHWSEVSRLASISAASGGNNDAARHHAAMALWYGGGNRQAYNSLSLLLSNGVIDPATFPLPFDPTACRPVPLAVTAPEESDEMPALAPATKVIPPDILVRDWRLFMGKVLNRGFDTQAAIARALEIFNLHFARQMSPGSLASVRGVYAAELGELGQAQSLHDCALAEDSGSALFLKRMAATLLKIEPDSRKARSLLEKAADLGKNQPLYQAELAHCLWEQGDKAQAIELMRATSSAANVLPEVPCLTAHMMRRTGQVTEETLDLLDQALMMAPDVRRFMIHRVHVLIKLGRPAEARDALDKIQARFTQAGDIAAIRMRIAD